LGGIVSILLRSNGVAQRKWADEIRRELKMFQSSLEATGLRNDNYSKIIAYC